jgi:hypothetical protein
VIFERDAEWSRDDGLIATSSAKYDAAFAVWSNPHTPHNCLVGTQNNTTSRRTPPKPCHAADEGAAITAKMNSVGGDLN